MHKQSQYKLNFIINFSQRVVMQTNSYTKSTTINNIISQLSMIMNKMEQEEQQSLLHLDRAVLSYIQSRNASKYQKSLVQMGEQKKIQSKQHIDLFTLKGLQAIHNQSQQKILELENKMAEFCKNRDLIHEHNSRFVKDSSEINESNHIIQLCKEMMIELSKFKDIQDFYTRLVQYRKKSSSSLPQVQLLDELDAYFGKISNFISDQEEGESSDEQKSVSKSLSDTKQKQNQDDRNALLNVNQNFAISKEVRLNNSLRKGQSTLLLDLIQ